MWCGMIQNGFNSRLVWLSLLCWSTLKLVQVVFPTNIMTDNISDIDGCKYTYPCHHQNTWLGGWIGMFQNCFALPLTRQDNFLSSLCVHLHDAYFGKLPSPGFFTFICSNKRFEYTDYMGFMTRCRSVPKSCPKMKWAYLHYKANCKIQQIIVEVWNSSWLVISSILLQCGIEFLYNLI